MEGGGLVFETLANLMRKLRGGGGLCTLFRSSHLNDIFRRQEAFPPEEDVSNRKKSVVQRAWFPTHLLSPLPHLSQAGAAIEHSWGINESLLSKSII